MNRITSEYVQDLNVADSHCHLFQLPPDKLNQKTLFIVPSYSYDSIKASLDYVNRNKNCYVAVGISPHEYIFGRFSLDSLEELRDTLTSLIKNEKKVVAIGEIGLDYHYGKPEHRAGMKKLLEVQLSIAEMNYLPVIIHSRDAEAEFPEVLSSYRLSGVMHAYSGDEKTASKLTDMDFYISIPPIRSKKRKKVIISTQITKLLIETDYPYIGKTLEKIKESALQIAEYKCLQLAEVYNQTYINACRLFNLDATHI